MKLPEDDQPLLDVAGGDPALSHRLRNSLKILSERTGDPEFRRLVTDVLAGRRGLREVAASPAFTSALNPRVEQFAKRWVETSEEERAEMAEQGEREAAALRERLESELGEGERWGRG